MRNLLVALAIGFAIWVVLVLALIAFGRRVAARELAGMIPALLRLFRDLLRDPRVPRGPKLWLWLGLLYLLNPLDLLPEFIPVIGPIDDAVVAALVLRHLIRRAGPEVVREHWQGGPHTLRVLLRVSGV